MTKIHAASPNTGDYTLCGDASDISSESTDAEPIGDPVFAQPGQKITCKECRAIIDYCRKFREYKQL